MSLFDTTELPEGFDDVEALEELNDELGGEKEDDDYGDPPPTRSEITAINSGVKDRR